MFSLCAGYVLDYCPVHRPVIICLILCLICTLRQIYYVLHVGREGEGTEGKQEKRSLQGRDEAPKKERRGENIGWSFLLLSSDLLSLPLPRPLCSTDPAFSPSSSSFPYIFCCSPGDRKTAFFLFGDFLPSLIGTCTHRYVSKENQWTHHTTPRCPRPDGCC